MNRIEWIHRTALGRLRIIADQTEAGWEFWSQGSWELNWYPFQSTPDMLATADILVSLSAAAHDKRSNSGDVARRLDIDCVASFDPARLPFIESVEVIGELVL